MTRVTMEDLLQAGEWLRCNEGLDGEQEACERVADWIDKEIDRRVGGYAKRHARRKIRAAVHAMKGNPK